jgi:hypothetical protein
MTATVGSLLDDIHARAWELCARAEEPPTEAARGDRAAAQLAAWPRLAASALRALDAVALEQPWRDDTASVRMALADMTGARVPWLEPRTPNGDRPAPSSDVLEIAVRLGAIADLLSGQPRFAVEGDVAAALGLRANLVAPVHAVAVATMDALGDRLGEQRVRWLLRGVMACTERFALAPAPERAGRFEDVAAITPVEPSLDGAIAEWARATTDVLSSRLRVTGTALQAAAGDALILTATAATVCAASVQLRLVGPEAGDRALSALTRAHGAWRSPTHWPDAVRLDGVRDLEQVDASRRLRQTITETLRQDQNWLPAEAMAVRQDIPALLATTRRGMHAVGNVALAHFQAVENVVRGRGRLWIAASAVTQPAFQGSATIEAAVRRGWVPMPRGEPVGIELLAAARQALVSSTIALAALDATAAASTETAPRTQGALRWDQGRIVSYGSHGHPALFETVGPAESVGAGEERRAPIALSDWLGHGPRR